MKTKLLLLIGILLVLPLIAAVPTFKQNSIAEVSITCTNNGSYCSPTTNCYATIINSNGTVLVNNVTMIKNEAVFNYSLNASLTSETGDYELTAVCSDGVIARAKTLTFKITPTGKIQTNILDNPIILIFGAMAFILLIIGMYMRNPWIGFLGSVMFILGGVYTMIYGLNNITDLYTRSVAIIFLGLGFIIMFVSAYELISDTDDE